MENIANLQDIQQRSMGDNGQSIIDMERIVDESPNRRYARVSFLIDVASIRQGRLQNCLQGD